MKRLEAKAIHDADFFDESHLRLLAWLNAHHAGTYWGDQVWKESRRCLNLLRREQHRLHKKMKDFKKKCLRLKNKIKEQSDHKIFQNLNPKMLQELQMAKPKPGAEARD